MGFRFFKRIKIAPGVTVNLSKSGLSTSVGPKGAKVTVGPKGVRKTVGIPGSGVYYTETGAPQRSRSVSPVGIIAFIAVGLLLLWVFTR